MRGLSSWIFSQGKPIRSIAPGAKFSTMTSQAWMSLANNSWPFGFLVSSVIERLLPFSMVKYRLSTPGRSRSWTRVMSPLGRSTLITSAPNQASNWVQVGPDCTWVMSRIRTPSSAFIAPSLSQVHGPPAGGSFVHGLRLGAGRVLVGIDPDVDHRRPAAGADLVARTAQRRSDLARLGDLLAVAAQHLGELAEGHVAQLVADVAALLAVFGELAVADLVHRRVVADHGDVWRPEPVGRLHVERGHAEGAVAVVAQDLLARPGELGGHGEARADAQRAERARVHPVPGLARLHRLRADRHHVAAVADVDRILGQELVDLPRDPVGVDRRVVRGEQRHQLVGRRLLGRLELLHPAEPALRPVVGAARGRLGDRAQDRARMADQTQRDVAVL